MADLTKDARVLKEIARLKKLYKDLPKNDLAVVDGLIHQAARLRISLDDMWEDICANGDVEQFSQSKDLAPYERERPVARIFNARDKNYQSIIKILCDRLPANETNNSAEELMTFVAGGKK